ncbi:MAG: carboxypeptidase regulatory-like domain-containing protein [Caldilineaceae bacterium]
MQHSIHRLLLAIGLCLGLSWLNMPSSSYAQATTGRISGRVTANDGHPIEGLRVQFYQQLNGTTWSQTAATYTDAAGLYLIDLTPATYRLQFFVELGSGHVYQREYYNNAITVETATDLVVVAGGNLTGIDAQLENATQVSGKVTDEQGNPISNLVVQAYHLVAGNWTPSDYFATAYGNGEYSLYLLIPGVYRIGFSSLWYLPQFYQAAATVAAGTDIHATANAVISGIDGRLHLASTISGIVTDQTGKPIQGVWVQGYLAQLQLDGTTRWELAVGATTDQNGRYTAAFAPGRYRLCFNGGFGSYPLYDDQCYKAAPDLEHAMDVQVGLDETRTGIDVQLKKAGYISGKVSDANGAPFANVQVTLYSRIYDPNPRPGVIERATTLTDAQGHYQLAAPRRDFYWVGFQAVGYVDKYYKNSLTIADATPITVTYQANITGIDAQLGATDERITGRVADEDGKALGGVQVVAYDTAARSVGSDITSADGGYLLVLPVDVYRIGFLPADPQMYVTQYYDKVSTLNEATPIQASVKGLITGIDAYLALVDATSPGDITGKVTDENGQGLSPIDIGAYQLVTQGARREWKLMYTDGTRSDGTFSIYNLRAGPYRLRFNYRGQVDSYLPEYYDNATTINAGKDVIVKTAAVTRNINAQLARYSAAHQALVAVDDTFSVVTAASTQQAENITGNVLQNDQLPTGKPLTTLVVALPTHGHVSLYTDGTFVYTPNGSLQHDTFTYVVSDGVNESHPATVSITADGTHTPPTGQMGIHIFLPLIQQ